MDFINDTELDFTDISSELYREYKFDTQTIRIENPLRLNVSSTGGHRVFDAQGESHYIPTGWMQLTWKSRAGLPNFVK